MADTFSNDLRLRLQESGSNAGTWGDLLNGTITNIASGFGQGSEAIPNASTHTITLADGVADEARSLYLKCTGGGQACTVTLGPNTISKVWIIDNETAHTLTFKQGNNSSQSGTEVAIGAGAVKVIVTNGAGVNSVVTDALFGLEGALSSLAVSGAVTATGLTSSAPINLTAGALAAAGNAGLSHRSADNKVYLQAGTGGFNILDDQQNTHFAIDSSGKVSIGSGASISPDADADNLVIQENGAAGITIGSSASSVGSIRFADSGSPRAGMIYYNHVGNEMRFYTNASERARLDSSGRLGLGTSSPTSTFRASIKGDYSSIIGGIEFDSGGGDKFTIGHASATSPSATLNVVGAGNLTFNTNNTEAFRITAARDMYFGQTTGSDASVGHIMQANGVLFCTADGSYPLRLRRLSSNGDIMQFFRDGTQVGYISATTTGVSYQSGSDRRLKENIADADDAGSKIDAIKVRKFDWIADGSHQDYGMIAQELQTVAPEAVGGDADSDKMMGVDYSKLVPMMLKEIQSLRSRVAELENN